MSDPGRTAILRAARKAFARGPYDAVTLREVAADAGVSAALIVKHFGGKEALFERVADFSEAAQLLLQAPNERLGEHAVRTLVEYRRANDQDLLVRVVFAAGKGDERALIREHFRDQVTRAVAARLTGPDAELRAGLITAQLLGLGALLAIDKSGPISTATPETIAALYAPGIQDLIH
ncbi:TetR/AcrR family transcriptional regulator [Kribbella jejuensis]|uniref:TetR family transcriptional regulator n=1 Tax=Kribbella jejuensis TaxID=236068 RepID=A0A542EQN1_9ACTN|nr:TetR/AcrR family transcriptional regulator [Kribbella jejuensis]TQJ17653.1 TetR family transcriptional regulator [Kribbella jejuensis]